MKKTMAKLMAMVLGLTSVAGLAVGCVGMEEIKDTENNLIIEFYNAGYGDMGWNALKRKFEEKNPGTTVTLLPNAGFIAGTAESKLRGGPSVYNVDLMLCGNLSILSLLEQGGNVVKGYDYAFADLTDVYDSTVPGETLKYKDKMMPYYENFNDYGGKYYSTNWASGANGLLYRADFFEKEGWEVPATTDELVELIDKTKEKGYVPFTWAGGNGYWAYVTQVWWAQYAGEQEIADFYEGKDRYGELSADCFNTPAFLETYNALEKCIYVGENSYTGSISFDQMAAQNYMWIDSNKICMMPNGSWVENEMAKAGYKEGSKNIRMMRAPVLSAVIYQTDLNGARSYRFETIRDEATLRAVVKAIDKGETSYGNVSAEEFAAVQKMRSYVTTTGNLLQAVVPSYSNAIPLAKEFLKFMATDEAIQIMYDACSAIMPFESASLAADDDATDFQKDMIEMSKNASWLALNSSKNKLFYMTELDYQLLVPEVYLGSQSSVDKKTGKEFFEMQRNYISNRWGIYKSTAGVS